MSQCPDITSLTQLVDCLRGAIQTGTDKLQYIDLSADLFDTAGQLVGYLGQKTLRITQVSGQDLLVPSSSNVELIGTATLFQNVGYHVTVTGTVPASGVRLALKGTPSDANWTFGANFPSLPDYTASVNGRILQQPSFFNDITINTAVFWASTYTDSSAALPEGLSLVGSVDATKGSLAPLSPYLPDNNALALSGTIQIPSEGFALLDLKVAVGGLDLPKLTELVLAMGTEAASGNTPAASTIELVGKVDISGFAPIVISAPLLQGNDVWAFTVELPKGQFSLSNGLAQLGQFVDGFPLALPPGVEAFTSFYLSALIVGIRPSLSSPALLSVGVRVSSDETWSLLIPGVSIRDFSTEWIVISPLSSPMLAGTIDGTIFLGEDAKAPRLDVEIELPNVRTTGPLDVDITANLDPQYPLSLSTAVNHFTGGVIDLPELDVTSLDFLANPTQKTLFIFCEIKGDWPFPIPFIDFNFLNFYIEYAPNNIAVSVTAGVTVATLPFSVTAQHPGTGQGWMFSGGLLPDPQRKLTLKTFAAEVLPSGWTLPDTIGNIELRALGFTFDTKTKNYSFNVGVGWHYEFYDQAFDIDAKFLLRAVRATPDASPQYSGNVQGLIAVGRLSILVVYEFQKDNQTFKFQISYGGASLTCVLTKGAKQDTVLTVTLGGVSFGDIVTFLVNLADPYADFKLDAPWDILNDIKLDNLVLVINLTSKAVGIAYKLNGLNLGLISLDEIGLLYQKNGGRSTVDIQIGGRFLDQTYDFNNNPLTWDLLNDPPPQVPGKGSKLLDLKYLGLGQHVTIANLDKLDTIEAVIDQLKQIAKPSDDPANDLPPGVIFSAGSGWLIGAQFVLIDTVALSVIFNDPVLYGLLVSLSGEKAEKFAGLSFEILYKKVTDDIGLYHIELKVPDAMRQLEFGEVSITLPIIDLDIYTNGNFRIDVGFPRGLDFSRSFSIQALPFIGYGGFYFALLNGSTSKRVPKIDNGSFSPVIEFGLALSLGLGKTIDKGVLKAGLSVTAIGIVEGVIGWFNPNSSAVKSDRYYWLQGTFAIVGKLYGEVDFGIISASLSVTAYASITAVIEAYQPILLDLEVGVEVEASVKILFIRIHFSFKLTLHESFTIGSASNPPWHTIEGSSVSSARPELADHPRLLRMQRPFYRPRGFVPSALWARMQGQVAAQAFNWTPPQLPDGPQPIDMTLLPAFTLAAPQYLLSPPDPDAPPQVQAVMQLFLENSIDPAARRNAELRVLAIDHETASSQAFNLLVDGVLRWMIYASTGSLSGTVEHQNLSDLLDALKDQSTVQTVFAYTQLLDFITKNYRLIIHAPPANAAALAAADEQSHTIFPMLPPLAYTQPDGTKIDFSTLNVPADYKAKVAAYFAQLQADTTRDVAACAPGATGPGSAAAQRRARVFAKIEDAEMSLATLIFQDYFAMLAKSALENADNLLNAYPYSVPAGPSGPTGPAGVTLGQIASQFGVAPEAILSANQASPVLQPGLVLDLSGILYQAQSGDTIGSIAGRFPTMGLTGPTGAAAAFGMTGPTGPTGAIQALVYANRDAPVLQPQAKLALDQIAYTVQPDDTIGFVAAFIQARNQEVIQTPDYGWIRQTIVDDNPGKLPADPGQPIASNTLLTIPIVSGPTGATGQATPLGVAGYAEPAASFAGPLGMASLALGASGPTGPTGPHLSYTTRAGDTLDLVAGYFALLEDNQVDPAFLAALKARYPTIQPGQRLAIPPLEHTVRPADTLGAIAESLNNPLDALAVTNAATPNLLAPLAVLQIPTVRHTILPNETLADIANTYNLTLADLAGAAEQQPLFAPTVAGPTGPGSRPLTIPQVQQIDIATLSSSMIAGGWYNNVSATVARFLLHGLRLPNPSDPAFEALSVEELLVGDQIFDLFSAYDMDGQQFGITGDQLDVTFEKPAGTPWIEFVSQGPTGPTGPLALIGPTGASADTLQIRLTHIAGEFPSTTFTPHPTPVPLPLVYDVPNRYGLQSVIHWQSADPPSFGPTLARPVFASAPAAGGPLGYLEMLSARQFVAPLASGASGPNGPLAGEPTLWPFPDTFLQRLQSSALPVGPTGAAYTVFTRSQTPGAASSASSYGSKPTPVNRFRWATQIEIKIRQVAAQPGGASWLPNTYLMLGADQNGRQTLLQIWDHLSSTGAGAELYLLYPPNPTAVNRDGLASDKIDRQQTFLLQTNLSTLTHSGPQVAAATQSRPSQSTYFATLEPAASAGFIRLLWECSVVGTGGFYLNYVNAIGGAGLPSTLFSNGNEGSLWLIVTQPAQGQAVYPFNNCAIIGDNINVAQVSVFAQWAGPVGPSGPGADTSLVPTMPPGNIGFQVTRPNPEPSGPTGPALGATAMTQNLFNVLSYQIYGASGPSGPTGPLSRQSVPLGPVEHDEEATGGLPLPAFLQTAQATWNFHHVAPAYKVIPDQNIPVCAALPDNTESPYGGISDSREVALHFDFHEIYGNRTIPTLAPGESLALPVKLGYYDELIPLAKWPGIGATYLFQQGDPQPMLSVSLELQLEQSLPGPGTTVRQAVCGASAHQLKYRQIYYQVEQPDLSFSLSTSVDQHSAQRPYPIADKTLLTNFVSSAYVFQGSLTHLQPTFYATGSQPQTLLKVAATVSVAAGALLAANAGFVASALFATSIQIPDYWVTKYGDSLASVSQNTASYQITAQTLSQLGAAHVPDQIIERLKTLEDKVDDGEIAFLDDVRIAIGSAATSQYQSVILANAIDQAIPVPTLAANNQAVPLNPGVVIQTVSRTFQVTNKDTDSLAGIASAERCSVPGLGTANADNTGPENNPGIFAPQTPLTVQGATVVTAAADTFNSLCQQFNDQLKSSGAVVTVEEIAVANQTVQAIFAYTKDPAVTITIVDYVVQKGDTLASLATKKIYGTFEELVSLNQGTANLFATGTALLLQVNPDSSADSKTLEQIVFDQGLTYAQLADANGPTPFKADVELEIPALATVARPDLYAPYIIAQGKAGVSSDTLAAIAGKFGTDTGSLAQINQNVRSLFAAGQTITLGQAPNQRSHTIQSTDTFQSLFAIFKGVAGISTLTDFATAIEAMPILRAGALLISELPQLASAQTLARTADDLGIAAESLALANCATYGFLAAGSKVALERTVTTTDGRQTKTTFEMTTSPYDTLNTLVFLFQQAFAAYEQDNPGSKLSSLTTSVDEIATAGAAVPGLVAANRPFLVPPGSTMITTAVSPSYPKSIFAVTVAIEISRNPQLIAPDARNAPNVGQVSSSLVPQTSATKQDPHSLKQFAVDFEAAFPGLKAATGKQVLATDDEAEARQLWAVDFGTQGINVGIPPQPPQFYALKPLSNQLLSRENVTIYSYVSGQGLIT